MLLQHTSWLRTFYKVTTQNTDYDTETDDSAGPGGRAHSGNIDAQTYVVGATVTPNDRLYFTGQFSLQNYRTAIPA